MPAERGGAAVIVRSTGAVMLRRWYVVAAVFLVAGIGGWQLHATAGVYATRTVVSFTVPEFTALGPVGARDDGIIAFASGIVNDVSAGVVTPRYASVDAQAYGAGVREGVFVTLPDAGGQWSVQYLRADVQIQVVGPTAHGVQERQQATIARIWAAADALQDAIGVPRSSRILYEVQPLTLPIEHIAPTRTMQLMAVGALALAALLVAAAAARGWDHVADRVRNRRGRAVRMPGGVAAAEGESP